MSTTDVRPGLTAVPDLVEPAQTTVSRLRRELEDTDDRELIEVIRGDGADDRLLLYRRFWEGMSRREVGDELGVSQAHVSRLEQGALETLKGLLEVTPQRA